MGGVPESQAVRRTRYLKMAAEAKTSAAKALTRETREAYLELEESWNALARGLDLRNRELRAMNAMKRADISTHETPSQSHSSDRGRASENWFNNPEGGNSASNDDAEISFPPNADCEQTMRIIRSR